MAETFTFTIKPITDLSDVKANVGEIQRAFSKLKLPDKITGKLANEVTKFDKAYAAVQKKMTEGIKTNADASQLAKSQNLLLGSWTEIVKLVKEVSGYDMSKVVRFDTKNIKDAEAELAKLKKELNGINLSNAKSNRLADAIKKVQGTSKSQTVQKYTQNMLDGLDEKQFDKVFDNFNLLKQHYQQFKNMFSGNMAKPIDDLGVAIQKTTGSTGDLTVRINDAQTKVNNLYNSAAQDMGKGLRNLEKEAEESTDALGGLIKSQNDAADAQVHFNKTVGQLEGQVESYFGLNAVFRTVANMAREAMNTVKELDAAMTETAVVTNFSVGDMWEKLPLYTAEANKLGSSIKDVYEATTLYYQQGLNTTQSMGLAVETLKMARIAGMDAKDATDAMTAALRGFNLELNQASAQRINDVYSELAAITASDTQEISTAMEKVASLAHNAGMEVETTSAFLAQMIETTREAPENLGTALKTVIARFQEMKEDPTKLVDSEGVMLDANKVDKALKSIGVNLMDTNGQFRKLDDVFLEIASRWDTLTMGQQRYIATMAAGSRQQSRFIAMMSDYGRTMELVDAAYDSSGASQRQFEKTLESMNTKLNQLKNAYDQFIMGLMNQEFLKGIVDLGTDLLDLINKVIDGLSSLTGPLKGTTKMILTLLSTVGGLTAAKGLLKGGISLGVQWFSGKEARKKFDREYLGKGEDAATFRIVPKIDRQTYDVEKAKLIAETKKPILQRVEVSEFSKRKRYLTDEEYKQGVSGKVNYDGSTGQYYISETVPKNIAKTAASVNNLGTSFQNAGFALQAFGNLLQNTPLAPFGKMVSVAGTALISLGSTFGTVSALMVKESMTLGAALWATLAPIMAIGAAVAALAGIGYALYQEFTRDKREMEALAEAASAASDAYDNLKTASEELKNSIQDIRDSESVFDGLVVGTTEWNQALVEANQKILDLIHKYEILRDYVTTDENGLMHISEEGFKKVQEQQAKWQEQAQALDILANSTHNNKLLEQQQNDVLSDNGINVPKRDITARHGREKHVISAREEREKAYDRLDQEAKEDWDSIQAQIEANQAAANKQAVRAALATSGEISDTVLSLFGQNLEEVQKSFENETDMSVIKQAYADFTGGIFDSVTGTITDISGEEIDVSEDALKKAYPQIMALLQFQEQADDVNASIGSVSKAFEDLFGLETGRTFINDLLNNNLDIDVSALEEFRNLTDEELEKALKNITDEQIQAITQNKNADITDLIALLRKNGENLKQAQALAYKNAGVWYAKTYNYSAKAAEGSSRNLAKKVTDSLTSGSAAALDNFMNQVSTAFSATASINMGKNLFSSLLGQPEEIQEEVSKLISQIDWTSAIERGEFYQQYDESSKAFKKLSKQSQNFIKTQKDIDKSLDLTGKQFEELVQSSDFLEILTNKWEDFANETGQLDTSGVEKMAEECGTLNDLLELGELDASTLATALNYFNETGSFEGITGAVLSAIDEFDSLDKLINQVKKDIDAFTPGENYEQGIEAFRGYANSLKENYENGKYSSADTLSYARALTNIKWTDYVKKHGNSNKSAEKELIDSLSPLFTESEKDTTLNILKRMEKGQTITGTKAGKTDAFTIGRGEEGQLQLHIDEKTTREEFQQALQDAYGFSEEFARAFTLSLEGQDWGFIDDNITDGFNKAGRSEGISKFVQGIADRALLDVNKKGVATNQINGQQIGENNQLVISQSELEALKDLGGYENLKEVRQALADELGVSVEHIRSFNEETQNADNYLRKRFGKQGTQKSRAESFLNDFKDSDGVANFDKATAELEKSGISASKALDMAVEMAKTAGEEEVKWGNQLVPLKDVINGEGFNKAVDELEDEAKWVTVGQKIGEAVANVLHEHGIGKKPEDKTDESQDSTKKTAGNRAGFNKVDEQATEKIEKKQQREEKIQSNIEQRNGQKEETLIITPQVNYSEARGEYINYKKDVEKNPPETEVKGNIGPLKNNVDKEVNAIESNPAIKIIDANNQPAITKDGTLVSTIQKTATKPVALNTQQADQTNRDAESRYSKPVSKTINLKTILSGLSSIPQKIRDWLNGSGASGINNHISPSGFYTGSMARGNGKGTLGPKGKGGLTLTGERGFEIAWLPSENRSMILGAHGPQMTNLPANAVVWNHKQSKRIVAQKGIPLGSMGTGNFDDPEVDVTAQNNKVKVTVSTDSKNKDKDNKDNKSDNKHTNWQDVEIDRYNLNQKINKITQKIEDKTKAIDKALEKIGTSYSTIADDVKTQVKFIKNNIAYQEDLQKSYKKGLKDIDNNKRSIWVGIESKSTDKNGETKTETKDKKINIGKYVSKDKNGAYIVNKKKIKQDYSSRTDQEAVFNAIQSEIDKLTSGYDNATKAIKEYKDQLDEITKKVADAFFNWENELTRIYELNNQIEAQDARRARLTSESSMLMAQIGAGYATAASAGKRLIQIQKQDATLLAERIKLTQQDIKAKREQLAKDVSYKDERTKYNEIKAANKKKKASGKTLSVKDRAKQKNAYNDYLAAKYSGKYIKRTKLKDGSYKIDFNEKQLERDKNRGQISDKTYEAIKEGYDKLVQSNADYQEAIQSGFDYLAEVYEQYSEYVKTMADLESDLIDAFEKQAQKEVDKLQSINTALTNATKKIIEQVKKNLDARRRAEDNAKTEADISKKQQRLAVLRANTSGGNAVEIAQLEKEVGDAQQSYGRTLEDQLLNNMQQQADQAAQQRQEQIDLAKQQIEYNKEAGVYAKQADKLLRDVKGNASKIKDVLNITKDESTGKWGKQVWEAEVQTKIAEGISASEGIKTLETQLGKNSSAFNTLEASLTDLNKKETKKAGGKKGTKQTGGKKDKSKKNKSSNGSKTKDTKSSKKKQQKGSNFYSGLETTYSGLEIIYSSLDRENPSAAGYLSSLPNRELKTKEEIQQLQRGINTLVEADLLPGIKKLNGKGIYASKTKAAVLALQQALGVKNAQGIWNSETSAALRKNKKLKYYQSGGLADSTGPAWLDGTKSRPELVLNSTDTKNFIILKDILSDTMRNLSHTESSDIYNSPTEVNINVNVDKISNDYDVKRLASTLKKEIVKDASYRNVTTVRKFR